MIVVADTSVILNLCCVGQADLLPGLFQQVWIPEEVEAEFERLSRHQPRFQGLLMPGWASIRPASPIPAKLAAMPNLHTGETAPLALALESHADAVLMQARKTGLLPAITPVIERLEADAGFWLAPGLVTEALRKCGET